MIGYSDWMRRTSVFGAGRSDKLVKVDAALKAYGSPGGATDANLRTLKAAFEAWKLSKGVDWRKSDRNKNKACDQLEDSLRGGGGTRHTLSQAEIDALKEIERANAANLNKMFLGKKLEWKSVRSTAATDETRSALENFKSARDSVDSASKTFTGKTVSDHVSKKANAAIGGITHAGPRQILPSGPISNTLNEAKRVVTTLLRTLFDETDLSIVTRFLKTSLDEIVAAVTPFVGMVKGGINLVQKWTQVAVGLYKKSSLGKAAIAFAPGDPLAAFEAVMSMIEQELNQKLREAATETVATLSQVAFTLVDLGAISGPVLGAAKALSNLVSQIYLLSQDYRAMKAANLILLEAAKEGSAPLTLEIFKVNPLLGCYLVACSDTSAIVNMAVGNYGKSGWTMKVEDLVRKVDPVRIKASNLMRESPFEIRFMPTADSKLQNPEKQELWHPAGAYRYKTDKTLKYIPTGKIHALREKFRTAGLFSA